jgi:hypothetical protein
VLAAIGYFLRDVTWNILDLPDIKNKQKRSAEIVLRPLGACKRTILQ